LVPFLKDNKLSGLLNRLEQSFLVKRIQRAQIDDFNVDALGAQPFRHGQCMHDLYPNGCNSDVGTFPFDVCCTQGNEILFLRYFSADLIEQSVFKENRRVVLLQQCLEQSFGIVRRRRINYSEAGKMHESRFERLGMLRGPAKPAAARGAQYHRHLHDTPMLVPPLRHLVEYLIPGNTQKIGIHDFDHRSETDNGGSHAGVGAAIVGLRPVVEIMYSDFLGIAGDEIFNKMAKWRYEHGSVMQVPMILRTSCGGGFGGAAEHSQSLEATFMHFPGLRIVYPSTPHDAKGLLKTLLKQHDPAIFFEHRLLYKVSGEVPQEEYFIPLGAADIKREGSDVTVAAIGIQVMHALAVAERLSTEGIDVEVIDLRTLNPLDKETLLKSVEKTGKLVVLEEGHKTGGVGAELAAIVSEERFYHLKAPIKRVAALDLPIPYSPPMEKFVLPSQEKLA